MIEKQIRADEMRKECEELKNHISQNDGGKRSLRTENKQCKRQACGV